MSVVDGYEARGNIYFHLLTKSLYSYITISHTGSPQGCSCCEGRQAADIRVMEGRQTFAGFGGYDWSYIYMLIAESNHYKLCENCHFQLHSYA